MRVKVPYIKGYKQHNDFTLDPEHITPHKLRQESLISASALCRSRVFVLMRNACRIFSSISSLFLGWICLIPATHTSIAYNAEAQIVGRWKSDSTKSKCGPNFIYSGGFFRNAEMKTINLSLNFTFLMIFHINRNYFREVKYLWTAYISPRMNVASVSYSNHKVIKDWGRQEDLGQWVHNTYVYIISSPSSQF